MALLFYLHISSKSVQNYTSSSRSFPDLIGEATLRQAQGDNCHGELVRPGEAAEEDRTMDCPVTPDNDNIRTLYEKAA